MICDIICIFLDVCRKIVCVCSGESSARMAVKKCMRCKRVVENVMCMRCKRVIVNVIVA
jgi:hypothetical protein